MTEAKIDIGVKPIEVPRAWNGYAAVQKPAVPVRADEVKTGDIILLQYGITQVRGVSRTTHPFATDLLHISGDESIVRYPHEWVWVIREDD